MCIFSINIVNEIEGKWSKHSCAKRIIAEIAFLINFPCWMQNQAALKFIQSNKFALFRRHFIHTVFPLYSQKTQLPTGLWYYYKFKIVFTSFLEFTSGRTILLCFMQSMSHCLLWMHKKHPNQATKKDNNTYEYREKRMQRIENLFYYIPANFVKEIFNKSTVTEILREMDKRIFSCSIRRITTRRKHKTYDANYGIIHKFCILFNNIFSETIFSRKFFEKKNFPFLSFFSLIKFKKTTRLGMNGNSFDFCGKIRRNHRVFMVLL